MTETICPVCSKTMKANICDNCKYDSTKEFPTELEKIEYELKYISDLKKIPIKAVGLFTIIYIVIIVISLPVLAHIIYPYADLDFYYVPRFLNNYGITFFLITIIIWFLFVFAIYCKKNELVRVNENKLKNRLAAIKEEQRSKEHERHLAEQRKAEEEKCKAEEERKMIELEKENRIHEEINEIIRINGRPDKIYRYNPDNRFVFNKDTDIIVFGQSKKLMMFGQTYDFKDILGCTLADNKYIVHGKTHSATTVSSWDRLLSLANTIAGDEDWQNHVIGTAQRNTVTVRGNDHEVHDITICVNVNSLSNPLVNIHIGNDTLLANEMAALFNVIVNPK